MSAGRLPEDLRLRGHPVVSMARQAFFTRRAAPITLRQLLVSAVKLSLTLPASSLLVPPMPLVDGALSHAATWALQRHDAGLPRYAQANAPHRRGAKAGPVGITREVSYIR